MKTIELSDSESKRWINDAAYRRDVRIREQERAHRLNEAVEVYNQSGRHLFTVSPVERRSEPSCYYRSRGELE